jgi:hypothetical protein
MRNEFNAISVSVEADADSWRVGFADAQFNSRRHLIVQRLRSPQAEDLELGLDGYHVELDDQSQSCYGGIQAFEIFADHLVVEFEDDSLCALGGDKVVVVRFSLRERQLQQLRGCLSKIFEGDGCFIDMSG